MAVGHVNNDGKLDVAVVNQANNNVSVLLGNGNGTLQARVNFATQSNPRSLTFVDLNGDGNLDLAVGNFNSHTVSVLLGNGDGTFLAATHLAAGNNPFSVVARDLNNDGRLDLAIASYASNAISVLLGNGNGTFAPRTSFATGMGPRTVVISDVNGDGQLDLMVCNQTSGTASILEGIGDGTFRAAMSFVTGANPRSIAVGDFNGDGKPDLVSSDGSTNLSVRLSTSTFPLAVVAPQAGTPQTAAASSAFPTALVVVARDGAGDPVPGVGVTFTAPASGASGTFAGGSRTVLVTTDAAGLAVAPTFTANATVGDYAVEAAVASVSTSFVLTNGEAPAFTSPAPPSGSVGLPYVFTVTVSGTPAASFAVATGALAPGLVLDTATGLISGTPTTAGTFSGTIAASNGVSPAAAVNFSTTIAAATLTASSHVQPVPTLGFASLALLGMLIATCGFHGGAFRRR